MSQLAPKLGALSMTAPSRAVLFLQTLTARGGPRFPQPRRRVDVLRIPAQEECEIFEL
jgi:hypothetical protein